MNSPVDSDSTTAPWTRPSSTSRSTQKYSSKRLIDGNLVEVWNSVWSIWKPLRSAANQVRSIFMPPKARTLMWPSGLRLHGQPQCSSCTISSRAVRDEIFDDVLLAQPVAAGDGVVEVVVEAVMVLHHAGRAAFGRDGVAAHRIDLRDQRDGQIRSRTRQRRSPPAGPRRRRRGSGCPRRNVPWLARSEEKEQDRHADHQENLVAALKIVWHIALDQSPRPDLRTNLLRRSDTIVSRS